MIALSLDACLLMIPTTAALAPPDEPLATTLASVAVATACTIQPSPSVVLGVKIAAKWS